MPIERVQFRRLTLDPHQRDDVARVADKARVLTDRLSERDAEIDLALIWGS